MTDKKSENIRRHGDREDLVGEYVWGDLGQLILLVLFLLVWVLDSFVLKITNFLGPLIPVFIKIPLAVSFFIGSFFFARKGLDMVFGKIRNEPGIIREGIFSIVRHPIYLGAILFYLSLWVLTLSLVALFVWVLIIIFYHFISRYEEWLLIDRFGKEYLDYKKKVPMLFPIVFRKKSRSAGSIAEKR